MNVVIWSLGTRGDVVPYRSLADELAHRGDSVTLVVPSGLRHLLDSSHHRVHEIGDDPSALLATRHAFALGGAPTVLEQARATHAYLRDARAVYRRLVRVALSEPLRSADLHIVTLASVWLLPVLRRLRPGRIVAAFLQPLSFSARYASVLLPPSLRSSYLPHSVGHRVADLAIWLPWRSAVGRASGARLPWTGPISVLHRDRVPVIYGFSRHLAGMRLAHLPHHHVTGSWSDATASAGPTGEGVAPGDPASVADLPEALQGFLVRHNRVVLVSFGSQSPTYKRLLIELMSLPRPPVPLVIQTHGSVATPSANAPQAPNAMRLVLDGSEGEVDHAAVFPRCSAVVHHGGAGTLHNVTRHGVASVVVPAAADTYFWADAAQSAGIAPPWRGVAQTAARSVVASARDAGTKPYAARAQELAMRMRNEDGPAAAARLIHSYLHDYL